MSSNIFSFSDCMAINFANTTINLDTCFILAYLDSNDSRGDKVSEIMEKWSSDRIKAVAISNHVVAEVIHNIFKNRIREVIYLSYVKKKSKGKKSEYTFTSEEQEIVANSSVGENLISLLKEQVLDRLLKNGDLSCNFENLLKEFKRSFPTSVDHLSIYYKESIEAYNSFVESLKAILNISVIETPVSDIFAQREAFQYMSDYQLGIFDAFHLALTSENSFDFFATLDGDFTNKYISSAIYSTTKILKIA